MTSSGMDMQFGKPVTVQSVRSRPEFNAVAEELIYRLRQWCFCPSIAHIIMHYFSIAKTRKNTGSCSRPVCSTAWSQKFRSSCVSDWRVM